MSDSFKSWLVIGFWIVAVCFSYEAPRYAMYLVNGAAGMNWVDGLWVRNVSLDEGRLADTVVFLVLYLAIGTALWASLPVLLIVTRGEAAAWPIMGAVAFWEWRKEQARLRPPPPPKPERGPWDRPPRVEKPKVSAEIAALKKLWQNEWKQEFPDFAEFHKFYADPEKYQAEREARAERQSGKETAEQQFKRAMDVLGLEPGFTEQVFRARFRDLMKKIHPDQAGSVYLSQQVTEARTIILKHKGWK